MNQFDTAPSCVQNAMMTKDKKPFTYTPGGIDLSQIKSPRMAKRIAMNAQNEGVTGQSRPSPLIKPNGTENGNHSPVINMGAAALGMPFQVFPTQPPQSLNKINRTNGFIPPPPPSNLPAPVTNNTRKSPTPQSFEPPPMGYRPEIKIPPNPMAALKKVGKPQEKNDFWVEEYKKERSKSPMVERNDYALQTQQPVGFSTIGINAKEESKTQIESKPEIEEPIPNYDTPSTSYKQSDRDSVSENTKAKCDSEVQPNVTDTTHEIEETQQQTHKKCSETPFSDQENICQVFNNHVSTPPPKIFQNESASGSQTASSSPNYVSSLPQLSAVQGTTKPVNNGTPSPTQSPSSQSSPKPILNTGVASPAQCPGNQASPKPIFNSVPPRTASPTVQAQQPRPQLIYNNVLRDTNSPLNRGVSPQPQFGIGDVESSYQSNYQPQKNVSIK